MAFNRWLVQIGGYLVGVTVGILYMLDLFSSDLSRFIATAGSLMIIVGALAGLSFSFSRVIETSEDNETAMNSGEKFFFATLCLGLSALAGLGALRLEQLQSTA